MILAALLAATAVSMPAYAAETIGNPATPATFVDFSDSLTFVIDQGFTGAGKVSSFSFYAGDTGDVTPLLFTRANTGGAITFTVTGVGTSRFVDAGSQTFDFGLTSGSDLVGSTSFFGFHTQGTGVVTFDHRSDTLPGTFANHANSNVGAVLSFDPDSKADDTSNGLNFRGYSINATAGAVPEPATWALMVGGFGMVAGAMRRKQKTAATFA